MKIDGVELLVESISSKYLLEDEKVTISRVFVNSGQDIQHLLKESVIKKIEKELLDVNSSRL